MISSTTRVAGPYSGTGLQTVFPFTFKVFLTTDVLVVQTDPYGNVTDLTLIAQYSVTLNSNQDTSPGGTITMVTAPAAGYTITISSQVQALQGLNLANAGNFYPTSVDNALDLLTILIQQLAIELIGTLRFPLGDPASATLPSVTSRSNNLLGFDSNGNVIAVTPTAGTATALSAALAAAAGAALIGYNQGAAGAVTITQQAKNQQSLSVADFGADPTYTTDSTAAFIAAITYLQVNANFRGGKIKVPKGRYKLSGTLAFTAYAAGLVHNIYLIGDGPDNTVLDWSGCPASTTGITFNNGAHFGVEDLTVANCTAHGIAINNGSLGTANYADFGHIRNVRVQGCGGSGILAYNIYMAEFSNIWSFGHAQDGFVLGGYSTSLKVSRCYASNNSQAGWFLNGITYSDFSACGSDSNTFAGYTMTNMVGVTFNGCGAESNGRDGFSLSTSTASVTGIPTASQDIHGVVFSGCFTIANSASGAGAYSTFLAASTANSRPIDFKIQGGSSSPNTGTDVALVLNGASGQVTCHKELFNDSAFTPPDVLSGTVDLKNFTVTSRKCLATISAAQSLPNSTPTTVTIATITTNDLGATLSGGGIVIPRGVNKVRVSFGGDFAANATGIRYVIAQKNGAGGLGLPIMNMSAVSSGDTQFSDASMPISVVAGDVITIQAYQNSGAALNINNTNFTWLCVEALS